MGEIFPVGFKHGCLSITSKQTERRKRGNIEKEVVFVTVSCTCGEQNSREFGSEEEAVRELGKIFSKRKRICGENCGNRKWNRIVFNDMTGTIHDTLYVQERMEEDKSVFRYRFPYMYCYRKYKCFCRNCGEEYTFLDNQFEIIDTRERGYRSEAFCLFCRGERDGQSSLEWRTVAVLNRLNVYYEVQKKFPDLRGLGEGLLSYDFLIYSNDRKEMRGLIECQGQQHYKAWNSEEEFEKQKAHDLLKRQYAEKIGVKLLEVCYKDRNVELTVETFCKSILN